MATLKGSTIASTYIQLVKRADSYSQTGTNIELMIADGTIAPTGLYLESGAVTDNVGIGTATPGYNLTVSSDTSADLALASHNNGDTVSYVPSLILLKSGGTATSQTVVVDGEYIGRIICQAHDGSNLSTAAGQIDFRVEDSGSGAVATNRIPTNMNFSTAAGASDDDMAVKMTISADGNVGIGTTAPGSQLEIANSETHASLEISCWSDTVTHQPSLTFQKSASNDINTLLRTAAGEDLGRIIWNGVNRASPDTADNAAMIQVEGDAISDTDAVPGRMSFWTSDAATNKQRMTIDDAGYVGIGTSTPGYKLSVVDDISSDLGLASHNNGNTSSYASSVVLLKSGGTAASQTVVADGEILGRIVAHGHDGTDLGTVGAAIVFQVEDAGAGAIANNDLPTDMHFQTAAGVSADDVATKMTITADGYVGIGIVAPLSQLHVRSLASTACILTIDAYTADYDTTLKFSEAGTGRWYISNDGTGGTVGGGSEDNILTINDADGGGPVLGQNDTAWGVVSDERIKENMIEMNGALDNISDFRCIQYNFIHDRLNGKDKQRIGIVAQDICKKYPEVVMGTPNGDCKQVDKKDAVYDKEGNVIEEARGYSVQGAMHVKYTELIPVLVKSIQELSAKVTALENA